MYTHFSVQTAVIQRKVQRPTNTVHPKRIRLSITSACISGLLSAPTEDAVDILSVSIVVSVKIKTIRNYEQRDIFGN